MVWLYRSTIPEGRSEVFYSFKLFLYLPLLRLLEGGGGVSTLCLEPGKHTKNCIWFEKTKTLFAYREVVIYFTKSPPLDILFFGTSKLRFIRLFRILMKL
jgi:hypothetical protein